MIAQNFKILAVGLLSLLVTGAGPAQALEPVAQPIFVKTFKTHSRLTFMVDEGVQTEWKNLPGGFEILFKGIGSQELGAPQGSEAIWEQMVSQIRDARLAKLETSEVKGGVKIVGRWKFPEGHEALASPKMEVFEYREKSPPSYIVDFWVKAGPTLKAAQTASAKKRRADEQAHALESAEKLKARRDALAKARADAEDITKFCSQPLSEEQDIFLPFRPAHEALKLTEWVSSTNPDTTYRYPEAKGKEKDATYYRLALELYRQSNFGLSIRTIDFFDQETPNSPLKWDMVFLRANALVKLGHMDAANQLLKKLMTDAREHPVSLQAALYLAAKQLEAGSRLLALETFLWLIQHHSSHALAWVFHLGAAEQLYALKLTDRAAKEYQWVAENAPTPEKQAEGALRAGDLYVDRQQYEQALASYYQAIRNFPEPAKAFPLVHLNHAESLYWLGQYPRAEEEFKAFLERYPNNPQGWRATFRLGEINGRKTLKLGSAESLRWYFETINRFPYSPGTTLARARMLPCGGHAGFNLEAAERYFDEEATSFKADTDLVMAKYQDFRALSRVRTMLNLAPVEDAVEVAAEELEGVSKTKTYPLISQVLEVLFRRNVTKMLGEGKKYEALAFYREKSHLLPKKPITDEILEPDYLLKLSQAASDLGLGEMAQNLAKTYTALYQGPSLGRSPAEGQTKYGSTPVIDDQIRQSERVFTDAKALWVNSGLSQESKIRELLVGVIEESPHSYEREVILGLMDEKQKRTAQALGHAVHAQLLLPSRGAGSLDQRRISYWIAALQDRSGESRASLEILRQLQQQTKPASDVNGLASSLGVAAVPPIEALILEEGDILLKLNRLAEAAETFGRAVDQGLGGNHALYLQATTLAKLPDEESQAQARKLMEKLVASKTEDFWKKLAKETLANQQTVGGKRNLAKEGTQ